MPSIPSGTTLAEMWEMWNNNVITSDTFRYWLNAVGLDGDELLMNQTQLASLVQSSPSVNNPEDFTPPSQSAPPPTDETATQQTAGEARDKFFEKLDAGVGAWDPATRYRDYMRERWGMADRPMGERIMGERRLGQGYQPALGGYLATEAVNPRQIDYQDATPGDVFSAYLRQDERPSLDQVRSAYGNLATGLSSEAAGKGSYDPYRQLLYGFGNESREKEARSNMLASALAALGGNPFATQQSETLGQVYDAMTGSDKFGGYGDFSKWITSAYTS